MAASTETINLTLPATTENYSITILNNNFEKIDTAVADLQADIDDVSDIIDDNITSETATYSSDKIQTLLGAKATASDVNTLAANLDSLEIGVSDGTAIGAGVIRGYQLTSQAIGTRILANNSVTFTKLSNQITKHSTSAKQVGTWLDDTPIWRVSFSHAITNTERSQEYVTIIPNASAKTGFVIGGFAVCVYSKNTVNKGALAAIVGDDTISIRGCGGRELLVGYIDIVSSNAPI